MAVKQANINGGDERHTGRVTFLKSALEKNCTKFNALDISWK